jgi:protein SCO1
MSAGRAGRGWFGRAAAAMAAAALAWAVPSAMAQPVELPAAKGGDELRDITRTKPSELGLKVDEKLGAPLPLELSFTDSEGRRRALAEFFTRKGPGGEEIKGKAAIVALVYYRCPVVCSALLKTVNECVRDIKGLDAGVDFNVLTFSFDPRDDQFAAQNQRKASLTAYGRADNEATAGGWHFFLHDEGATRQLANAFGFQYSPINGGQDFAHPVVFFLVTPEGKIARYMYGFGHTPLQLRLALFDAGEGTITASLEDQFLTFCYMFDPKMGVYTLSAIRVMQVGGVVTMLGLGGLIGVMLIGERLKKARRRAAGVRLGAGTGVGGFQGKTAT